MNFLTAKENGHQFIYNYCACEETIWTERAYWYAVTVLNAPREINIDFCDSSSGTRITAIMPHDLGYDFSEREIEEAQNFTEGELE